LDAAEPFVSAAPDGSLWMSWLERNADSSVSVRAARRQPEGARTTPTEVARRNDLFVNWADFLFITALDDSTGTIDHTAVVAGVRAQRSPCPHRSQTFHPLMSTY
jgi:hypothetical protein